MKKWLIAAMAASLVMAFTACGNSDDSSDDEKDSKASVSSAAEDDTSSAAEESTAEESKADESAEESSEEASEAESAADESSEEDSQADAETGLVDGVYTGNGYKLNVDSSLWTDQSATITSVDCAFSFIGESDNEMAATGNFNVVTQSAGTSGDMTAKDYADLVMQQYESFDSYTVTSNEATTVNGVDGWKIDLDVAQSGFTMNMSQVIIIENGKVFCISYGAEESVFDSLTSDFQAVVDSFTVL